MLFNLNVNVATAVSPRLKEKSPCDTKTVPSYPESPRKGPTLMGRRFPRVGKNKSKIKLRNVKIVHQNIQTSQNCEFRSHSIESNRIHPEMKRGKSTQSLFTSLKGHDKCSCGNHRGNKVVRGLKAIGFSQKNKLLRKIPAFRNKFNSDSSAFEGSESEVDSLSDWSQMDGNLTRDESDKRDKYHRTYSDSSYPGLDRVLEVKESTLSPPETPRSGSKQLEIRKKIFGDEYDRPYLSTGDSTSDTTSEDDSSSISSAKETNSVVLSSVRRVSCKRSNFSGPGPSKYWHLEKKDKKYEDPSIRSMNNEKEKIENEKDVINRTPQHEASENLKLTAGNDNPVDSFRLDVITNLDLACPKISIVSYDQEVSACSLTHHKPTNTKSTLHKSKSVTALSGYPSHECESTLSSVLIAPDYKEHGPCLIPSSRNDAEITERIPGSGTPNVSIHVVAQHPSAGVKSSHSPAKVSSVPCIHRRSSDSDLSITPKGKYFKYVFLFSSTN